MSRSSIPLPTSCNLFTFARLLRTCIRQTSQALATSCVAAGEDARVPGRVVHVISLSTGPKTWFSTENRCQNFWGPFFEVSGRDWKCQEVTGSDLKGQEVTGGARKGLEVPQGDRKGLEVPTPRRPKTASAQPVLINRA